eukprot:753815-Pyramimonas_sp.AAC.1
MSQSVPSLVTIPKERRRSQIRHRGISCWIASGAPEVARSLREPQRVVPRATIYRRKGMTNLVHCLTIELSGGTGSDRSSDPLDL